MEKKNNEKSYFEILSFQILVYFMIAFGQNKKMFLRGRIPAKRSVSLEIKIHIRNKRTTTDGCDHTSTNAPDPIRTPQLSVLGRE